MKITEELCTEVQTTFTDEEAIALDKFIKGSNSLRMLIHLSALEGVSTVVACEAVLIAGILVGYKVREKEEFEALLEQPTT